MDSSTHLVPQPTLTATLPDVDPLARPAVAISDLCCEAPETRSEPAAELFRQLRHLPHLNVVSWCSRNGVDRFRFARRVTRVLGVPPSTILRCYLATAVADLRRNGHSYARLSGVFGYADASSLHRALRRHRRSCPAARTAVAAASN